MNMEFVVVTPSLKDWISGFKQLNNCLVSFKNLFIIKDYLRISIGI